jgi:Flp pilus assembly protein CpaB
VGGFLVAAAAVLVLTARLGAGGSSHQQWVVATRHLAAGTRITPADLGTESMSLPANPTGAQAFHSPATLAGRVLAAPLLPGELVQQGALVPAGTQPALRPVTVSLDAPDAVDLSTGTPVDVLVTDGSDPGAATTVVVRGATVLDVTSAGSSLISSSGGDTVTIGVSSLAEVEAVVHADHTGSVSVVVAQRSDGSGLGAPARAAKGSGG